MSLDVILVLGIVGLAAARHWARQVLANPDRYVAATAHLPSSPLARGVIAMAIGGPMGRSISRLVTVSPRAWAAAQRRMHRHRRAVGWRGPVLVLVIAAFGDAVGLSRRLRRS